MTLRVLLSTLALAVSGCATPTFSYIDGNPWFKADIHSSPVIVLDIDGKSDLRNPIMVDPGVRSIRVQGPPAPGFPWGDTRTLVLDVKPCMHYYLKAVRKSAAIQDFTPEVDYVDRIHGCN